MGHFLCVLDLSFYKQCIICVSIKGPCSWFKIRITDRQNPNNDNRVHHRGAVTALQYSEHKVLPNLTQGQKQIWTYKLGRKPWGCCVYLYASCHYFFLMLGSRCFYLFYYFYFFFLPWGNLSLDKHRSFDSWSREGAEGCFRGWHQGKVIRKE